MKISSTIANYGEEQLNYLVKILDYYDKSIHDYSVNIISTSTHDFKYDFVKEYVVNQSIGDNLTFICKDYIKRDTLSNKYDYIVYTENDSILTDELIDRFIYHDNITPDDIIPGFSIVEPTINNDEYIYICNHPGNPIIIDSSINIKDYTYVEVRNGHQTMFILDTKRMIPVVNNKKFYDNKLYYKGGGTTKVAAASNIFQYFGMRKMIPINDIYNMLLIHLPNKYRNMSGFNTTISSFIKKVEQCLYQK